MKKATVIGLLMSAVNLFAGPSGTYEGMMDWGLGPVPISTTFTETEGKLTMSYTYNQFSGGGENVVLEGNLVTGAWSEDAGAGKFRFTFSDDFKSFDGVWGWDASDTDGGTWSGAAGAWQLEIPWIDASILTLPKARQ